jgi:hypothetical protein
MDALAMIGSMVTTHWKGALSGCSIRQTEQLVDMPPLGGLPTCSRTCVMVQRRPDMQAAVMTRKKPNISNSTSPATSIISPVLMIPMVAARDHVGVSMPQRKAKKRRKRGADDLHIV